MFIRAAEAVSTSKSDANIDAKSTVSPYFGAKEFAFALV